MNHTYLLEEGEWIARGVYSDEKGNIVQVEGHTFISHQDEVWINDGSMKVLTDTPVELFNRYEITPFTDGSEMTTWKSYNPALGVLKGIFLIIEDTIMSKYSTEDGRYTGFEFLKKIDDVTYENRGFALNNNEKLSSWAVELKKIK